MLVVMEVVKEVVKEVPRVLVETVLVVVWATEQVEVVVKG